MKRKITVFCYLFLVTMGIMLSSCTKENNGKTIALIGTEDYIGKNYTIEDILSVIPDSDTLQFAANFGVIPKGAIPDSINGKYVMNPKSRVYSNSIYDWPIFAEPSDVALKFSNQHNGIVTLELTDDGEQVTDTVFVMGNGNAFTVYFIEDKPILQARIKRGIIMSGKLKKEGIENLMYASIIMEATGSSYGEPLVPGTYYIYKDGNGLAERIE